MGRIGIVRKLDEWHSRQGNFILELLVIYLCTYFVYKDFSIPLRAGFIILFVLVTGEWVYAVIRKSLSFSQVDILVLLSAGTVIIQYLRPDANRNIDTVMYLLFLIVFALAACIADVGQDHILRAMKLLKAGAFAFASFMLFFTLFRPLYRSSVYRLISIDSQLYYDRFSQKGYSPCIGGAYTYTNYILLLGIACVCGDICFRNHGRRRVGDFALLLFSLLGMLLTQRRGELAVVLFLLLLSCVVFLVHKWGRKVIVFSLAAIVGLAATVIALFPLLRHVKAFFRYTHTIDMFLEGRDITAGRIQLYQLAFRLFRKNPIFGIGWKQFQYYVPIDFKRLHGMNLEDVHNNYLQFLCETGIVGTILLLIPVCLLAWLIMANLQSKVRIMGDSAIGENKENAIKAGIFAAMVYTFFLIISLLDPSFYKRTFLCINAICIIMYKYSASIQTGCVLKENAADE